MWSIPPTAALCFGFWFIAQGDPENNTVVSVTTSAAVTLPPSPLFPTSSSSATAIAIPDNVLQYMNHVAGQLLQQLQFECENEPIEWPNQKFRKYLQLEENSLKAIAGGGATDEELEPLVKEWNRLRTLLEEQAGSESPEKLMKFLEYVNKLDFEIAKMIKNQKFNISKFLREGFSPLQIFRLLQMENTVLLSNHEKRVRCLKQSLEFIQILGIGRYPEIAGSTTDPNYNSTAASYFPSFTTTNKPGNKFRETALIKFNSLANSKSWLQIDDPWEVLRGTIATIWATYFLIQTFEMFPVSEFTSTHRYLFALLKEIRDQRVLNTCQMLYYHDLLLEVEFKTNQILQPHGNPTATTDQLSKLWEIEDMELRNEHESRRQQLRHLLRTQANFSSAISPSVMKAINVSEVENMKTEEVKMHQAARSVKTFIKLLDVVDEAVEFLETLGLNRTGFLSRLNEFSSLSVDHLSHILNRFRDQWRNLLDLSTLSPQQMLKFWQLSQQITICMRKIRHQILKQQIADYLLFGGAVPGNVTANQEVQEKLGANFNSLPDLGSGASGPN